MLPDTLADPHELGAEFHTATRGAVLDQSFDTLIESTNGVNIYAERSMYWDSNGVFWAGGLTTAATRLP